MKATTTVFFDGQFASADWEDQFTRFPSRKQLHVENVNRKIDVLSKAQEGHENKGRARQTTIVAQRSVGEDPQKHIMASLVHLNRQATFDPSVLGKVESIDFYLDLMNVDSTPGVEVQYAIVLQQDGVIFQSPPARLTGTKKWKGFISESLVAVDFLRLGKPTALSPHHRPDFSKQAPPIQFGYVLHVSGADASLKSVTSIGEWKVSVTHRTDLGLSLSQTQEFKQRLESEVLERQRLERAIIEQRLRAEQELREIKLKAEEEINSLRMSLPIVERDSKASSHARTPGGKSLNGAGLGRTEDLSHLLDAGSSGDVSRYCVEDKYVSIVQAAQNRLQEVDSRRKAERQRKEKLEEEREDMRRTIELERQGREEAERKWAEQYEEANKSADEEKRRLDEELASYRRRIFTLEQELLGECKSKEQREEELCRARDEAAAKHEEVEALQANIRDALDTLAKREAEHAHEKRMEECRAAELERQIKEMDEMLGNLSLQIAALEHEKEELQDQVEKLQDQIERHERAWREACEKKEREAKEALEAAEARLQAEVGAWRERIGKCRIEHAQEKEFLQQQFAEEKASAEDALKKVSDAHERKEDAWKRTAKELNKKLKHCTQKLSDAEEEIESRERAMMEAVNGLEEKLKDAHREVALRDEVAEGLQRNKSAVEQQLRATIEQLDSELHNLHEEAKKQRETWEQEKWQLELERAEAKREADLAMQRMLDESKDALDQERQRSEAHADSLSDMTARFEHAQHQITTLEATVQQLQQQMAERDATERKLAVDVALLTEHADNERRARMDLEQAVSNAEEGADKLNLRLDAEIRRNRELQQTLATVSAERASLVEKVEAEREGKKQATQELEALKDNYDLEKTLREKIALELFAEIDARKEGEKRQASIISALNEHMKKQAEAIVQLDLALRQEQADRMQLEEQVDAEMVARVKAEEALRKLDEIFKNASKEEDAEWELVTDEERKVRQ